MRFETPPGEQAQCDYGELGLREVCGIPVKIFLFAMLPGFSRFMHVEFATAAVLKALREGDAAARSALGISSRNAESPGRPSGRAASLTCAVRAEPFQYRLFAMIWEEPRFRWPRHSRRLVLSEADVAVLTQPEGLEN